MISEQDGSTLQLISLSETLERNKSIVVTVFSVLSVLLYMHWPGQGS